MTSSAIVQECPTWRNQREGSSVTSLTLEEKIARNRCTTSDRWGCSFEIDASTTTSVAAVEASEEDKEGARRELVLGETNDKSVTIAQVPMPPFVADPPKGLLVSSASARPQEDRDPSPATTSVHSTTVTSPPIVTPLPFDNLLQRQCPLKLYDRESQESELLEAFHRCCCCSADHGKKKKSKKSRKRRPSFSGAGASGELVLVTGASGCGKTRLVESVLRPRVAAKGGFFIEGKFDCPTSKGLQQQPEPYQPVVRAFSEYVRLVVSSSSNSNTKDEQGENSLLEKIRQDLKDFKDAGRQLLIDLIPPLRVLFEPDCGAEGEDIHGEAMNSSEVGSHKQKLRPGREKRQRSLSALSSASNGADSRHLVEQVNHHHAGSTTIVAAFRQFVRRVCSHARPLVIFLDDLQWAEPASLELLSALVLASDRTYDAEITNRAIPGLMLVGACRDDEVSFQHRLSVTLREVEAQGARITEVEAKDLDRPALEAMVADILSQSPDRCQELVDLVWKFTHGNVFFVVQLLQCLQEEGLLCHSAEDDTWTCDSEANISAGLDFDDAVHLISSKIQRLDEKVQHVLMVAACLGAEFDEYLLRVVVGYDVIASLSFAEEKGLVMRLTWGSWRFFHDQIQQSAYSLIPSEEREGIPLQIGRKLWGSLSSSQLNKHAFLVVNQLRQGVELVEDQSERDSMAVLLLRVGEKATETSAFAAAADYLHLGIQLLCNRHWRDQYELSLNLYSAAAEVEYCNGNFDRMDTLVAALLQHARNLEDKSRALMLSIYSLGSRNELQKAIDRGFEVLRDFEEFFPSKPSSFTVVRELWKTKKMLRRLSDSDILGLPRMRDSSKLSAMRIMNLLFAYTLNGRPLYAPLIATRLVQTCLIHGMSRMACVAFSAFGMLLCMAFDDVDLGVRYGRVSLSILDKFQAKEWLPRTYSAVYGCCFTAVEPLRHQLKPLLTSHRVGLSGDIEFSMLSAAMYAGVAVNASVPLPKLLEDLTAFLGLMKLHKQINMIQFLRPNMQFVKNLMGQCDDPCVLSGDIMDGELALEEAIKTQNSTIISVIHLVKLALSSFFQQYEAAERASIELSKCGVESFASFSKAAYWLHEGLVSVALSKKQSRRRLGTARRNLKRLKALASRSKSNFLNKVFLLEAEIASVTGQFHQSLLKYDDAIALAEKEELWNEVGLAGERAASALERRGRRNEACAYLETAIAAYKHWGAFAKVAEVSEKLLSLLSFTADDSSEWVHVPVKF